MCGEHSVIYGWVSKRTGSSPHVRGARLGTAIGGVFTGIIPACAGSTSFPCLIRFPKRDHPRMCGEHTTHADGLIPVKGSSPHVRGALESNGLYSMSSGIIPACAGSTHRRSADSPPKRDHPRMCGEHFSSVIISSSTTGSSPHVRGAPCCFVLYFRRVGIIPACAGSTSRYLCVRCWHRDHPRMCGEHTSKTA